MPLLGADLSSKLLSTVGWTSAAADSIGREQEGAMPVSLLGSSMNLQALFLGSSLGTSLRSKGSTMHPGG